MTPEQYRQAGALYDQALELEPNARAAFLVRSCGGDEKLRREVESLLQAHERAGNYFAAPAIEVAAGLLAVKTVSSLAGQRLNHYQVLSLLGAGGMGEVYLAEDTRLGRKVALKLLPVEFTRDADRVRRFEQEARAASALNHPNIITIHEIGQVDSTHYIVAEFVAGETLRQQMTQSRLGVGAALEIAAQIASALAAAHHAGVVHRDIKPENVMVRSDGLVKVLDFGLAKLSEERRGDAATRGHGEEDDLVAASPRRPLAASLTLPGQVMGTPNYMSPEQARGLKMDHRTDIFSLGVLLYEMITGRRPFEGATTNDVIAALLTAEPPPLAPQGAAATAELERVVRKCLAKERDARYPSAAELSAALQALRHDRQAESAAATRRIEPSGTKFTARRWPVVTALVVLLIIGLLSFRYWRSAPAVPPVSSAAANRPNNPAAYDDYLRGRFYANSQNKADNETAIKSLERAVAADPNFAAAHAELAQAYIWRFFLFTPDDKQWEEKAFMAIEKALSLDRNSAVAHLARGRLLWTPARGFPHERAIEEYRRALALDANLDEARNQLALVYNHIGAFDLALAELQKAVADNPTNSLAHFRIGETLLFQGKYEQALPALRRIPKEANLAKVGSNLTRALIHVGQRDEAAALVEKLLRDYPDDTDVGLFSGIQALLAALNGEENKAEAKIKTAIAKGKGFGHFHHTAYDIACAYAVMKKPAPAIEWLQAAADDGFPCYPMFEREPYLESLRKDPRFLALMAKLKEQWEQYQARL